VGLFGLLKEKCVYCREPIEKEKEIIELGEIKSRLLKERRELRKIAEEIKKISLKRK